MPRGKQAPSSAPPKQRRKPARKMPKALQESFLEALAKQLGSVSDASRESGVPRRTVYKWRDTDRDFADRWDQIIEWAQGTRCDKLARSMWLLAIEGSERPVYYKGVRVGKIREWHTSLMEYMARKHLGWNPKDADEGPGAAQRAREVREQLALMMSSVAPPPAEAKQEPAADPAPSAKGEPDAG